VPNVALDGLGVIAGPCAAPLYVNNVGAIVNVADAALTPSLTVIVAVL
jgi:hypothetical protein